LSKVDFLNLSGLNIPMVIQPKQYDIWKVAIQENRVYAFRRTTQVVELNVCVLGVTLNKRGVACALVEDTKTKYVSRTDLILSNKNIIKIPPQFKLSLGRIRFFPVSAFQEKLGELSYEDAEKVHDSLVQLA
jgi:hypothetical protein